MFYKKIKLKKILINQGILNIQKEKIIIRVYNKKILIV
jgi:hypothetical protein